MPDNAYRYNGKELDEATGHYFYGFRMYDPAIARFTGVDPIADQFAWVSVYNYAENSPITNIDLHGLQAVHFGQLNRHIGINGSSEKFIKKHPVAALGILAAPALVALAPAVGEGVYIYAANNPHVVETGAALVWGSVTDDNYPNSSADDAAKAGRHTLGKVADEVLDGATTVNKRNVVERVSLETLGNLHIGDEIVIDGQSTLAKMTPGSGVLKNAVIDSSIKAGGDIHIGDIITVKGDVNISHLPFINQGLKNVISNSNIQAGGNVHIGDKIIKEQ